jgi:hypothetical protein
VDITPWPQLHCRDPLEDEMIAWWLAVALGPLARAEVPVAPHGCREGLRSGQRPPMPGATSLVSEIYPLRVWLDPGHEHSGLVAPLVLQSLERAWEVQVDTIGFRAPVLPDPYDGPEFDVYLFDYGPYQAFVMADSYDEDPVLGDGYNAASSFMVLDRELPVEVVPSFVSHEFNHACHYATDFSEPTLPIWEGTATAAQEWTVGEEGYWQIDVPSFQEVANFPVLVGDSYTIEPVTGKGTYYEYGAALWVMWLDEQFGDGQGAGGRALWEAAANEGFTSEPDVADAFAQVSGMSLGDTLNAFALVRFLTGDDWDPRGLAEARTWTERYAVPAFSLTGEDLPLVEHVPAVQPMITGQLFFDLDLRGGLPAAEVMSDPWLVVRVSSASGLETGLMVSQWGPGDPMDASAVGPTPQVELPLLVGGEPLSRVVVALTNLGPAGWDGEDPPYQPGDQVLTLELLDRDTPDTLPDPVVLPEPDEAEEPRGCGCNTGGAPAWLVLLTVVLAAGRRTGA